MSTVTAPSALLRTSLRLLMVLAFMGFFLTVSQSTVSAQCTGTNCPGVKIYNCTTSTYTITLNLCCGGVSSVSAPISVPVVPCANSATFGYYGPSCTVTGVASITPPPPTGVIYDPLTCNIRIY